MWFNYYADDQIRLKIVKLNAFKDLKPMHEILIVTYQKCDTKIISVLQFSSMHLRIFIKPYKP